jgi:DNA-binding GntR family transcriptional regulator
MDENKDDPKATMDHTQKAYMGIRQMLFHNEISPGQKISYRELAEKLNMSPTPVIQALKFLEFQNLVRREPNRGYFTQPLSLQEVEEIYDLREVIELSMLSKAIRQLDKEGTEKLQKAFDAYMVSAHNFYRAHEAKELTEANFNDELLKDMEFHLTLASLSQCRVHQAVLRNLFDLLYLKYRASILFVTAKGNVDIEHRHIFEAVIAGDFQKSKEALALHLSNVKKHALSCLAQKLKEKKGIAF